MYFITFCVFTIYIVFQGFELAAGKVVHVNLLWRHGDRAPILPYPTDPYKDPKMWPVPFGHLTTVGISQHFELGQWLRQRYNELLSPKFHPDILHIKSSNKDRCLMSAEANLAGMYPPEGGAIWDPEINWQPMPIHTLPEKLDNLLAQEKDCPAYNYEFNAMINTPEIKKLNASFEDVYKVLNENTGRLVDTIEQIDWVFTCMDVEKRYNFSLPEWTKDIFPYRMFEAAIYNMILPTYNTKLARLKVGPLIKDMINNMKLKKDNDPKGKRVNVYSAHDTTVANLLHAMGVFNNAKPPYAACVIMELRQNPANEFEVAIFYRNDSMGVPYPLVVPNCTVACPFDKFVELMEPITVGDWDAECQDVPSGGLGFVGVILIILCILVLLLICGGAIVYFFLLKKSK